MSRTPTRPVQVRLPEPVDQLLTRLARERGASKTQIVVEALACLEQQVLEQQMEAGYRELAGAQHELAPHGSADEHGDIVAAGLAAGLAAIPE